MGGRIKSGKMRVVGTSSSFSWKNIPWFPTTSGEKKKIYFRGGKKCHDESALNGNKSLLIPGDFFLLVILWLFVKGTLEGGERHLKNPFYFFIRGEFLLGESLRNLRKAEEEVFFFPA